MADSRRSRQFRRQLGCRRTVADSWARNMPEELVAKFVAARRRVRKVILAKGWTMVLFAACASFGVSIILDRLLFLGSRYRLALFVASIGAIGSFLLTFLVVPLVRRISARRIARSVERKHPELGDILLSAVELSEQLAAGETYTSRELIAAVSRETARRAKKIDFRSAVSFSAIRKPLLVTLGAVCAVGGYCYLRPMVAANVLQRMLYPYSGPPPLTFTRLTVVPGNVLVPTGTDVEIKAIASGKIPRKASLYLKRKPRPSARGGQTGFSAVAETGWEKVVLARENRGEFRHLVRGLISRMSYRIAAGDARSESYWISVSDRPVIVGIEVDYTYPEYTGRPAETKTEAADIVAVKGTKVQIAARSNKLLRTAKLRFGGGTQSLVSVGGSTIRSQVFEVKAEDRYSFELLDTDGFSNVEAVEHAIHAVEDKPPVVGITKPERYSEAMPDEVVGVSFRAADDFGIEKLFLEYSVRSGEAVGAAVSSDDRSPVVGLEEEKDKVTSEERKGGLAIGLGQSYATQPRRNGLLQQAGRGKTEVEGECALSLAEVGAKVGEVVVFRVAAEDNNTLSGPGKGFSAEHTIRVISSETSLRKIEQEQQDLTRRLLRLINQQKDNKSLVDKLSESLKGKEAVSECLPPVATARERGSLDEAKLVQRAIEEAGGQLAGDFAGTLDKMKLNPMMQLRTIIEMADVTEALRRVSKKEMPDATQKASEAAGSKKGDERDRKLAETSGLQQKIVEALERIGKEFAQLQEEQRLLSLAETAGRLAKEQLAVRAQTAAALPELSGAFPEKLTEEQKRRLKKLVDAQEKLKEKLSEFEERLQALRKQLEYANSSDSKMVASALKYFQERGEVDSPSIPKSVSEAIEALRANHLNKGTRSQTEVYESLLKLAEEFQKTQAARLQGEFSNTGQGLQLQQPEIDKLIEIQKTVIAETERLPRESDQKGIEAKELGRFEKVSQSQGDLLRRTTNFRAILEEIFGNLVLTEVDPIAPLKDAEKAMGEASGHLGKLKAGAALGQEKDSLKNLEKAREELSKALARMMANASLQQAMQAMSVVQKMILEQKKVNEGTRRCGASPPAGLDKEASENKTMSDPMLEALRQLINQQLSLRDRAMLLKDYLKMMVKAGEMMGESADRLKNKETGQQTQQIQSQTLELLMQMLVQLRANLNAMAQAMGLGGSSGAGARGGVVTEPIFMPVAEGVNDRWANLPPRMKQELLEAWTEKFAPEFRELIALYYKRLSGGETPRPAPPSVPVPLR